MNLDWMKARQTRYGAYVAVYTLVVIAVLGAFNWLANRHNKSYDATKNKRFSLADQTTKVASNLTQDVRIRYFDRTREFDRGRDLLDRYSNLSPRLSVEYVDPDKKPDVAKIAGVQNYGAIYIETGGRKEEAKSLTEEEVTSALIRALKEGVRTVCAVRGSGEHSFDDTERTGYSVIKDVLERNNYKTESISLIENPEIPAECTIVLVGGPKLDYPAPIIQALREFVEKGGRALYLLDPPIKARQEIAENAELLQSLAAWGVTLGKDVVYETSAIGQLLGFGQLSPLVTKYETHPIVRDMREIVTAFPLSRTVSGEDKDKAKVEKLFSTNATSYASSSLTLAEGSLDPKKDRQGPHTLAVAGTYDTGDKDNEGRFVVVGSSEWLANNIPRQVANHDLFLNMMNWLSSDEDLISIRPKDPEDRRLNMTAAQVGRVFWSSVVGLPLVVIACGLAVWWRRR